MTTSAPHPEPVAAFVEAPATLSERLQASTIRMLGRCPDIMSRVLSGERTVMIDGQTLDPQLQLIRATRRRRKAYGYCQPTVPIARARLRHEIAIFTGPRTPVGEVRNVLIPGEHAPIRIRHYVPAEGGWGGSDPQPLLVYLHGGGFVIGDIDTHDEPCRLLCRHAGIHVVSVDYRLAPEHPFPAGLRDTQLAIRWAQDNAVLLGADPRRIAVGGDSAGGNLATVAARLAVHDTDGHTPLVAQLLIYPATDAVTPRDSHRLFGKGFFISYGDIEDCARYYVGGTGVDGADPCVSPLRAPNLDGLPPAFIVTAGFDMLRDEGEAYAAALRSAGNTVHWQRFATLGHTFINMTGVCPAAHRAMIAIARQFRAFLESPLPT